MIFFVLGVMIALTIYYIGVKHGKEAIMYAVNRRVEKVLNKLTLEEKLNFNAALAEIIKEEKKK